MKNKREINEVWIFDQGLEERKQEVIKQIAEDTCRAHGVFLCDLCLDFSEYLRNG